MSFSSPQRPDQSAYGRDATADITSMPQRPSVSTAVNKQQEMPELSYADSEREKMGRWNALRLAIYLIIRFAQIVVAVVCMAFLGYSRNKRPSGQQPGTTEGNTEIAIFAVAGLTVLTALCAILLHFVRKTRERMQKSRLSWATLVLNFVIFVVWIILVLILVISVDCSKTADGGWCTASRVSLATALVSAMLALAIMLRSFSVLVRAKKISLWSSPSPSK